MHTNCVSDLATLHNNLILFLRVVICAHARAASIAIGNQAIVRCPRKCSTLSPSKKYVHEKQGAWHLAGTYKNKNTKISSEGLMAIIRKFVPTKILRYTV